MSMTLLIRSATREDADVCGEICYRAFCGIADQHNFPHEFPALEVAKSVVATMISKPGYYGIVAELDGRIAGSNFMDERSLIAGIGPISVDPEVQNHAVGRQMMNHMLDRVVARSGPGVRLVQTAYHNRSLSLYAKLGFEIREPLSVIIGKPLRTSTPGYTVRRATEADLKICDELCFRTHGHDRGGELRDSIKDGMASVVEHGGGIIRYARG